MGLKIRKIEKNEYPSFAPTADKIAEMCFSAEYGVMLMAETETGLRENSISCENSSVAIPLPLKSGFM